MLTECIFVVLSLSFIFQYPATNSTTTISSHTSTSVPFFFSKRLHLFLQNFRLNFGHLPARFVAWPVFVIRSLRGNSCLYVSEYKNKVNWSRYRPGVAQRVGTGIALLFHDRGTRRGWVVSSTPRPRLPPVKTWYPFYRRLGGPQGRSGRAENLVPTGDATPDRPARSQSLYRLNYTTYQITKDTSTFRN